MQGLKEAYGDRLHLHYAAPLRRTYLKRVLWRSVRGRTIIRFSKKRFLAERSIVYGHFKAHEFDFLRTAGRGLRYGMFFRDPVEMVCSYYFHLQKPSKARFSGELEGAKNIVEFARLPRIQKFFAIHLGKKKVDDLDYVGIVEQYEKSLELYRLTFGEKIATHFENVSKQPTITYREKIRDAERISRIEEAQKENLAIYEKAVLRQNSLMKACRIG